MVCKECGTYNAENLTHCRVCAAKLRDETEPAAAGEASASGEGAKPSREFVHAPNWPTRAYTGATEIKPIPQSAALRSEAGSAAPSASYRPSIPPRAPAAAAPATVACPHCGKPALVDAPFCPYCGESLAASPKPQRPVRSAQQRPVKRAPQPVDEYDDEDEYEDEEEETTRPAPRKAAKPAARKPARRQYDDDEDEYDDEYEDDEYDDEYEDDEYDDEFDDDMPKKRGKGTTFLFWGLIVLLLALIVVFGMFIAKKNFDGDVGKMFAAIGNVFNKGGDDVDIADPNAIDGEPAETAMNTATISEFNHPETGEVYFNIDIHAATGSTIRLITDAQLQNDTATIPSNDHALLQVARDVFMPNKPCDSEIISITPNIQVVSPDGVTTQLAVPEVTVTIPKLSMTITEPASETVNASYDNKPIAILGQVDNYEAGIGVFVNDEQVYVDDTGAFTASYTPKATASVDSAAPIDDTSSDDAAAEDAADDATGDEATDDTAADATADDAAATADTPATAGGEKEYITIEARQINCMTYRKVITVEPYVKQTMALMITNDLSSLSSKDGIVTLQGTATPGATITATCPSADVTFGQALVDTTGTFTMPVTAKTVGAYDIALTGTMPGYYDGTAKVTVERPPSDDSKVFLKKCTDIKNAHAKIVAGTTTSGNFKATGRVTEIISTEPIAIFRVQISEGVEIICANRSASNTINSADLKEKKQIAGTLNGLYESANGNLPYLWGWFIWNK